MCSYFVYANELRRVKGGSDRDCSCVKPDSARLRLRKDCTVHQLLGGLILRCSSEKTQSQEVVSLRRVRYLEAEDASGSCRFATVDLLCYEIFCQLSCRWSCLALCGKKSPQGQS